MQQESNSIRLRYVGRRFDGGKLPVEVLPDLAAFRELVLAYAREQWLAKNVRRQRMPKEFTAGFSLRLVAIEDGSAIPVLELQRDGSQALLPGFADQVATAVDEALDAITRLFKSAELGQFPRSMTSDQIRALNKFGAGLLRDERIEFYEPTKKEPNAYINTDLRRAILSQARNKYNVHISDVGVLEGCYTSSDDPYGHIVIGSERYGEIRIELESSTIKESFDGNLGQPVELSIVAEMNAEDRVVKVLDVDSVNVVDEKLSASYQRCVKRISDLAKLEDGWRDGTGIKPAQSALEAVGRFVRSRVQFADLYRIYPTTSGGIQIEFVLNDWDYTLEFHPEGMIEFFAINENGGSFELPAIAGIDNLLREFDDRTGRGHG